MKRHSLWICPCSLLSTCSARALGAFLLPRGARPIPALRYAIIGKATPLPALRRKNDGGRTSARCGPHALGGQASLGQALQVPGRRKKHCRKHSGAPGSGAPRGNQNALKHGMYTREALEERRSVQNLLRQSRMLLERLK